MNQEQQIKALAELDNPSLVLNKSWNFVDGCRFYRSGSEGEYWTPPKYLTSYDAIIPLIQKQTIQIQRAVCEYLIANYGTYGAIVRVSAAQLCEALLRATGKWIE